MNRSRVTIFLLFLLGIATSAVADDVIVTDDISANTTWTADNTYFLDGLIFVNDGATLTIEPGTVIKGLEQASITTGDGASALIVRRGGMIMAQGTAAEPIIFTSEFDDVNDPFDLVNDAGYPERALWGGVIILGRAPTTNGQDVQVEGIPIAIDALYGGDDPNDNSGVFTYVSIRHAGFSISGVEGDEINGLTMGAVGDGTEIHHIEVFANFDDGYEWFGGTVNTHHMIAAFVGDDGFDYDQGYQGYGQFWFSIHAPDVSGRGGEHDGCEPDFTPCSDDAFSQAIVSNATYIGSGTTATPGGESNDAALRLRQNVGAQYHNSVFTDFTGRFATIDGGDTNPDAVARFFAGDLQLKNNVVFGFGAGDSWETLISSADEAEAAMVDSLSTYNQIADPMLAGVDREIGSESLDPRPLNNESPLLGSADFGFADNAGKTAQFNFERVSYAGAFFTENWALGWTALDQFGYFGDLQEEGVGVAVEGTDELPSEITLEQNYPNPFNPVTNISFALPQASSVRLTVHDMLGREMLVLVDESRPAGNHSVRFDALDLPSGMYIYRLETAESAFAKKMLLLK